VGVVTALTIPDPGQRADLAEFVARVVALDPTAGVRLRGGDNRHVTAWAATPFDVLATRSVAGTLDPADVAVPATSLLTALAVERADTVDPGSGASWRAELPPDTGWTDAGEGAAADWAELVERGLESAAADGAGHGPSAALLDGTAAVLPASIGPPVRIPLRCLFALSGLGLLAGSDPAPPVRVAATGSWLRLETPGGAVVRRRITALPLLV
jgi:hypothetical protein